jgi:hypothetical protein
MTKITGKKISSEEFKSAMTKLKASTESYKPAVTRSGKELWKIAKTLIRK